MNPTKTQCTTVSKSRTAFLSHPHLFIYDVPFLCVTTLLKILGVTLENKFTIGQHLHSVSSSVAQ